MFDIVIIFLIIFISDRSRKKKKIYSKCAERFSEMCECPIDIHACDQNKSQMMYKIHAIKYNSSYIEVNCKSLCNAFTCNGINTQTTTEVDVSLFMDKKITSERAGTTIPKRTEENTTSKEAPTTSFWIICIVALLLLLITFVLLLPTMYVSFAPIFFLLFTSLTILFFHLKSLQSQLHLPFINLSEGYFLLTVQTIFF